MTSNNKLDFCFDTLSFGNLGYPNLAQIDLKPHQFDITWPRVLPARFFAYFRQYGIEHHVWTVEQAPKNSWYPIALGWHDFQCDYLALLSPIAKRKIQIGHVRILFYYHEGDNPFRIKQRIDSLCLLHGIPINSYVFVSANTSCKSIENFIYMPDHELFFSYINRTQLAAISTNLNRDFDFTVLNRTHKWWRATCMADLEREKLLTKSLWSYSADIDIGDCFNDNPIEIDAITGLRQAITDFIKRAPFTCDQLDSSAHNNHQKVNLELYHQSYCHVVLETHFDADQSGGTFLTEKTFKCIKYGQPFVLVGPAGSLQALRDRGYRVFDSVIDTAYDRISNNTQRWLAVKNTLHEIKQQLSPEWLKRCQNDVEWNCQHFQTSQSVLLKDFCQQLDQLNTGTP